jgi:hypothetical protein
MTEKKPPRSRRSEPPLEELKKERDDFIKTFFQKGAQLTEELVREREANRQALRKIEEENARLRAQIASDDAIRDLLKKIEELERDKDRIVERFREAEALSSQHQANTVEIESELANLANLYVASYQLHSSLTPRGVMRHVKELLGQLVGAESFAVYLVDDRGEELFPVASEGVSEGDLVPIRVGSGPIGGCFAAKATSSIPRDTRRGSLDAPVVCFPLVLEERATGVVAIFRTLEQKSSFIQVDHELFKLLGAQAMWALVAARQFTDGGRVLPPLSSFRDLGT